MQKPVVLQAQKSEKLSNTSKFSSEFAKYMIGLIKKRTANSTVIAVLEEAIRAGTVASKARMLMETATSPAASEAILSATIAQFFGASGASGATSNANGAP